MGGIHPPPLVRLRVKKLEYLAPDLRCSERMHNNKNTSANTSLNGNCNGNSKYNTNCQDGGNNSVNCNYDATITVMSMGKGWQWQWQRVPKVMYAACWFLKNSNISGYKFWFNCNNKVYNNVRKIPIRIKLLLESRSFPLR